ncbi:MAG: MBL fold metallo-hydrolase [Bacteroidota bacterium]|nr:MBL fold metallo-hydrolase [Bacteroidota bacterium]MDP3143956.1 MBL fold metallo-hydrolase [Bacteroidota bacterium]
MHIQQLYTNCLAQGAYYISSNGEAVIIDPLRETQPYIDLLKQNNDKLKYIFETHFHADFVSGHVDLAKATGATIVFGPNAQTDYKSYIAKDNEELKVGDLTIKVLHTPGHTLESTTYLLLDKTKKPISIFTGDTLFIGDVGRPDLAIKSNLTQEDLAGMLYDSLRNKIMPLPDDVIVYPAHGAGSACGKNMSKETFDTLGNQKKTNYALQNISKEDFIKELTTDILPAPQYFAKNAFLNKKGYKNYSDVLSDSVKGLSVKEFEEAIHAIKPIILDVRTPDEYAKANVPGSLFIGIDGQFAPWVGTLITDLNSPILLITPKGREEETVMRLSRVGYDNCIGYLEGGIEAWINAGKKTETVETVNAEIFFENNYKKGVQTLDVRKPGEYDSAHLKNAETKPLDFIFDWIDSKDKSSQLMIHCAGGYRSMIAISILKANGYKNLTNVDGGYSAISKLDNVSEDIVTQACTASK